MRGWTSGRACAAVAAVALAAGAASTGCSGAAAEPTDGAAIMGQFADCTQETRATPYAPGTVVRSSAGQLDVTLVDNRPGASDANGAPGSWVKGSNTWRIHVSDVSGASVSGLGIQTVPRMPDHGHGTSITPVTTDEGAGDYLISPLYLYMGGYWQITLNVRPPVTDGGASSSLTSDSVVFNVCIPG